MSRKAKLSEVDYAEIGLRILIYFLEELLIFAIAWILMSTIFWTLEIPFFILLNIIAYLIGFFYFFIFETYNNGQTLGKMLLHFRTVNEETFQSTSKKDFLINCLLKSHWLPCTIDFVLGTIKNLGEPQKRFRIMQNASKTVVIKD